ncbi:hypothetical protein JYU34_019413 [Plutella xylostella]|uniref:Zinc finger protein n=2 Tax=Plutella xylostella TaxID=51655 RepID=A0ABQ7PWR5_PLUXY|nr:gastrula zinc finger protein XlCGF17.1 [Plutella xylostella]KAG7297426.1 hypothetical protein JYU34_019413 [Plutella xylostella]
MLQCRLARRSNKQDSAKLDNEQDPGEGPSTESVDIKVEPDDDFQEPPETTVPLVCRVCLKDGHIPIFGDSDKLTEDVSEALSTFANIEITMEDNFPKYLCTACYSLLQGAIIFRKTAQHSDKILKKPKKEIIQETPFDDEVSHSFDEDNSNETREKTYRCKKCDIDFKCAKDLQNHRKVTNHWKMKRPCPICNKVYSNYYFKRHMEYHKHSTPYVCDVCGKAFVLQGHFSRHRMTHDFELPFQCTMCPYRGRFTESLKMHMRSHTGEKPYQCPECPVRCINMSNLKRHRNTHKKEHDFKCETCGKGFFMKRDLDLHFKVDHTGIKDHVCNVCGKAFGYRKQMMKHQLKVHKREKLKSGRMPLYLQVERKKELGERV